jgi:hypothetical protein
LVSLVTVIAFWKRKESRTAPEPQRIIPLPNLPPSTLGAPHSTSLEAVNNAREALKVLRLERQILGSAVTTIYESQTKGVITEAERDQLLEKYKVDLKRLEKAIEENQQVVDLFDLEVEREEVTKNYKAKLEEIDARLKDLRSGTSSRPQNPIQLTREQVERGSEKKMTGGEVRVNQNPQGKEEEQVTDGEKRIEKIRAEILQAMDRLEQIETEE